MRAPEIIDYVVRQLAFDHNAPAPISAAIAANCITTLAEYVQEFNAGVRSILTCIVLSCILHRFDAAALVQDALSFVDTNSENLRHIICHQSLLLYVPDRFSTMPEITDIFCSVPPNIATNTPVYPLSELGAMCDNPTNGTCQGLSLSAKAITMWHFICDENKDGFTNVAVRTELMDILKTSSQHDIRWWVSHIALQRVF